MINWTNILNRISWYQHDFLPTIGINEYLITPNNILTNTLSFLAKEGRSFLLVIDELIVEVKTFVIQPYRYLQFTG
ncbi:MAG: hypothetical protein ACTS8H_04270 [Arsenophonus sp. NC-PE1-MAG3]